MKEPSESTKITAKRAEKLNELRHLDPRYALLTAKQIMTAELLQRALSKRDNTTRDECVKEAASLYKVREAFNTTLELLIFWKIFAVNEDNELIYIPNKMKNFDNLKFKLDRQTKLFLTTESNKTIDGWM